MFGGSSMKFENLMYDGKNIKVVVDLDDVFIESNDLDVGVNTDDSDTLDLSNIATDIATEARLDKED